VIRCAVTLLVLAALAAFLAGPEAIRRADVGDWAAR